MLIALLLKVGLPILGVGIGWLAKKWHLQPYVEDLERQIAAIPSEAVTPKPGK